MKLRSSFTASLIIALIVAAVGWLASTPSVSADDRHGVAKLFNFETMVFPESSQPKGHVAETHPDLDHLAAWVSAVGASVAFGDLDEDGLDNDVCFTDPRTKEALVATAPGTPKRFALFALPLAEHFNRKVSFPTGCLIGDFNEDGLDDMLVYFFGRAPLLALRSSAADGGGGGAINAAAYLVSELTEDKTRWYTAAATQADVDGDGHVDLVFGNYFLDDSNMYDASATDEIELQDTFSHAVNGGSNHLYLWKAAKAGAKPQARFEEAADAFTTEEARAWTLAVGAADLNDDGLPELYFANDFGPDRLFLNESSDGQVKLRRLEGRTGFSIPKSKVIGRDSFKGMGIDFADVNGDGRFDMFVSNIAEEWALQESHFLWMSTPDDISVMQDGVAPYEDLSKELGVAHSYWGWDTRFGDFNNDGVSELLQATGFVKGDVNRWPELAEFAIGNDRLVRHPKSWPHVMPGDDVSGHVPNPFYAKIADGRYVDISAELGVDAPYVTRGIATSDVDGDGDLDVAFANQWEPSVLLYNKQQSKNTFLALHVLAPTQGAAARKTQALAGHPTSEQQGWPAIGATVRFDMPNGGKRLAQVAGCNGHSGCSSKNVHFGLGDTPAGARIEVSIRWRSATGTHVNTFTLTPGWHTILLGEAATSEAR